MKPILISGILVLLEATLHAQIYGRPAILRNVGIEQTMGAQVPLDVPFVDEQGRPATLRAFSGKPIILALVYYQCPSLCNMVLSGATRSLRALKFDPGSDYELVAVSFDARENYPLARDKKQAYLKQLDRAGGESGWHFLTGSEAASRMLADAVGFHYTFDSDTNQFVHPSAITVLTPEGRVSRYFYGIDYPVRDLKFALIEASGGKIGSPVDQVQLFCFHYDPANGKYGLVIMNVLRLGGLLTLGALLGFILLSVRRDARVQRS